MSNNQKVAKIHPDLFAMREAFNSNLCQKLGIDRFPKIKSDLILAKSIKESGLLNFEVIKPRKRIGDFDLKWTR